MLSLVSYVHMKRDEANSAIANTLPLLNEEANFVFAKELGHIGG